MSKLLEGKTAIVLGVWNKWSIAYAIAQAFSREGAKLLLTYQNERAKPTVEELGRELGAAGFFPCEVQQQSDIDRMAESLKTGGHKLDIVVHSLAAAKHEDLNQPFLNTSREGFQLATRRERVFAGGNFEGAFTADDGWWRDHDADLLGSTRVVTNYNVMGVAKAALEAEVKYLASELGGSKIRVNAISAGAIKTISARGVKDLVEDAGHIGAARAIATQYRSRRGRGHGRVSGERSRAGRDRKYYLRRRRIPHHGAVGTGES